MKRALLLGAALACISGAAHAARVSVDGVFKGKTGPSCVALGTYTGPGDVVSFTHWGGLRAYSRALADVCSPLAKFERASDTHTCDILSDGTGAPAKTGNCSSGGDNGQSPASFCNATTCSVAILYDEPGANNWSQAALADQPVIVFSCLGASMCMQAAAATVFLQSATTITPAAVSSISVVGNGVSGTSSAYFLTEDGSGINNRMSKTGATTNKWRLGGLSGTIDATTATDNVWHAGQGVINGASSVFNLDGVETTGTITGATTTSASIVLQSGSSTTIEATEVGWQNNVANAGTPRTQLCQNEQAYYGSGNFGAAC